MSSITYTLLFAPDLPGPPPFLLELLAEPLMDPLGLNRWSCILFDFGVVASLSITELFSLWSSSIVISLLLKGISKPTVLELALSL
jgi:hypothetical protein